MHFRSFVGNEKHQILDISQIRSNTNTDSDVIDTRGTVRCSVLVGIHGYTNGTYAIKLQHSDSASTGFTDVPSAQVISDNDGNMTANKHIRDLTYNGDKRYVRLRIVSTGSSGNGAFVAAIAQSVEKHPNI